MQFPEWTKPALVGAGAGAVALAIVGFGWGGWMTGSSAMEMSKKQSMAAAVTALTPYCVRKSKDDPNSADLMAKIEEASGYKKRSMVEETGWATPLGAEKPDRALAEACLSALTGNT
ncbi:hypothetical protein [uncultured Roseibium sp.]|uniref:hypothetical protein n=1 Tax=uncultured Roseibium sp. TaxID=1936171 RepID=UPI003216D471